MLIIPYPVSNCKLNSTFLLQAKQTDFNYTVSYLQLQIKFFTTVFSTHTQPQSPERLAYLSFHNHRASTNPSHPLAP